MFSFLLAIIDISINFFVLEELRKIPEYQIFARGL